MAFLEQRFRGSRFSGGVIPLEVLGDLAALREMVVAVAKWRFFERNPDRQRVPRGFSDSVRLNLVGIRDGSAVVEIDLVESPGVFSGFGAYREQFADAVGFVVRSVNSPSGVPILPPDHYAYFDRVGRSLRQGEAVVFSIPSSGASASLDQERRHSLVAFSRLREFTDEVVFRGLVPEIDQDHMTFELQPAHGPKVEVSLDALHFDIVREAFNSYTSPDPLGVVVSGIGRFNVSRQFQSWEFVADILPLDPLDVVFRLDGFRSLRDGWLDGDGVAPSHEGLDWLSDSFDCCYPPWVDFPYTYPMAEGGVQFEWSLPPREVRLEVDLKARSGDWSWVNLVTRESCYGDIDLSDSESWVRFVADVLDLGGVVGE